MSPFLCVKKSTEVKPKHPKANRPTASTKVDDGSYFPQLNIDMNNPAIRDKPQRRPINLLEEVPPFAPSIIDLKNLIIILDLNLSTYKD